MSHNTWIHRIVRVGVRPLVATPVTPNQLTTLRLASGLAATAAFAVGDEDLAGLGRGALRRLGAARPRRRRAGKARRQDQPRGP